MVRILALTCCLLIASTVVDAQSAPATTKTGTTAASFLKISVGARSIAMGGAYTGVSNDISAMYWNPAGLATMSSGEAMFHHVNWIADIGYDVASAAIMIDGFGTLGGSFSSMNVGDMEVTTTKDPEGTGELFTAGATSMGLSYARSLTDRFSIGFNVKYIREYIYNENASSFALDVGTLYVAPLGNGLRIGASMSNFGAKMKLEGRDVSVPVWTGAANENLVTASYELDSYDLPLTFRVGLATEAIRDENSRLTLAVDAVHPNDNTEYVNSGLEYTWANLISVRGGWKSAFERDGEQGLTLGGGVEYSIQGSAAVLFDYAYQDFGRLKEVHYFSVGVKF
jgi:opacity protein-like surface antigen